MTKPKLDYIVTELSPEEVDDFDLVERAVYYGWDAKGATVERLDEGQTGQWFNRNCALKRVDEAIELPHKEWISCLVVDVHDLTTL